MKERKKRYIFFGDNRFCPPATQHGAVEWRYRGEKKKSRCSNLCMYSGKLYAPFVNKRGRSRMKSCTKGGCPLLEICSINLPRTHDVDANKDGKLNNVDPFSALIIGTMVE